MSEEISEDWSEISKEEYIEFTGEEKTLENGVVLKRAKLKASMYDLGYFSEMGDIISTLVEDVGVELSNESYIWIESRDNVSYSDAYGPPTVMGEVHVYGNAVVKEDFILLGNIEISGDSSLSDVCLVGNWKVSDSHLNNIRFLPDKKGVSITGEIKDSKLNNSTEWYNYSSKLDYNYRIDIINSSMDTANMDIWGGLYLNNVNVEATSRNHRFSFENLIIDNQDSSERVTITKSPFTISYGGYVYTFFDDGLCTNFDGMDTDSFFCYSEDEIRDDVRDAFIGDEYLNKVVDGIKNFFQKNP